MQHIRQNIWVTFLLAILVLLALGKILPKNPEKYLRERYWVLKTHADARYNMVILGDSRVYRGVSPDEIRKELPQMEILNFGYSNGGLNPVIYKAAEEKLVQNSEQRVILLGVTAFGLNPLSRDNEMFIQELTRPREEVFERKYLNQYLNFFSPVTPEKIRDLITGKKPGVIYRSIYHEDGWAESEKIPADTMEAMPHYKRDFSMHITSTELIGQMAEQIRVWERSGIKVFAFRPPAAVPLVQLEDSAGKFNEDKIKQAVIQAGGIWIDVNPHNYKTYDGSHLHKNDARKLSRKIAKEIKLELK